MISISFVVPGRIRGKERPRFGKGNRVYTPRATVEQEKLIALCAKPAMRGGRLLQGALSVEIYIWMNPPKSWPKARRESAHWVTGKPDLDNVAKTLDALNGVVWMDDSQVAGLRIQREYMRACPGMPKQEFVQIVINELEAVA